MDTVFLGDVEAQASGIAQALAPVPVTHQAAVGVALAIVILVALAIGDLFSPGAPK